MSDMAGWMQVTAVLNVKEQGLLAARNGLEGLAGLLLQHDAILCLRSFLQALRGAICLRRC